jgi:hypothetical protein
MARVKDKTMKNRRAKRVLFTVSLVAALLGISSMWSRYVSGQNSAHDDYREVRDALRRGGLREAARVKGHYVGDFDPHWDFGRFDIEALTKNSAAVVVGVPSKIVGSRLVSHGQLIVTDYEVKVQEAFKGSVSEGSTITVSLPGGKVEFEDETSAELRAREFEPMRVGATYTIFLSESNDNPGVYTLSGGPQGLVEIVNDTTLKPHGRPADPVSEETKGKGKDDFLKEVRSKAEKWPLPGKCCQ